MPGLELNLGVVFAAGDLVGIVQVPVNHVLALANEAASAAGETVVEGEEGTGGEQSRRRASVVIVFATSNIW